MNDQEDTNALNCAARVLTRHSLGSPRADEVVDTCSILGQGFSSSNFWERLISTESHLVAASPSSGWVWRGSEHINKFLRVSVRGPLPTHITKSLITT